MRTILDETQDERDEEIARYLGTTVEEVRMHRIDERFGPVVHDGRHIRSDSYDFLYAALGKDNPAEVLRPLSTFNVVRRRDLVLGAMRHMGNLRGKRILDFGCGPGAHGVHFLQCGAKKVDFLDVVGPVYKFAKWRVKARNLTEQARFLTPQSELRKHTYDVVLCVDVLEHVASPFSELRRLMRAMRPGCFLLLQIGYHVNPKQGHFKQSIGRLRTNRCQRYIRRNLDALEPESLTKAEGRRCYYFRKR